MNYVGTVQLELFVYRLVECSEDNVIHENIIHAKYVSGIFDCVGYKMAKLCVLFFLYVAIKEV